MSNLNPVDRSYLETLFEMGGGYVLSFSNATFEDFVRGSTGEEIYSDSYSGNGDSKANRLRAFWNAAPNEKVAALLGDLLALMIDNEKVEADSKEATRARGIIADLGGDRSPAAATATSSGTTGPTQRRAFVSYSVERKHDGGAVKECLTKFGYECFLAHDDLRVSEEWKDRILQELGDSDVFVALLSREFMNSKWCGQELGYIVSRPDVLVIPLSLDGTMPYGFIGHLQGKQVHDGNLATVLEEVLYRKRPRQMIPTQIRRVASATSWRGAEALVQPLVAHFDLFTDEEVDAFARAAAGNSEVYYANDCVLKYIPEFVRINGARLSSGATQELLDVLPDLDLPGGSRQA